MIYILTGEDIVSSRNKLNELLKNDKNIVRFDGKKTNITDIELALESNSLFVEDKAIVIDGFSKVKPQEKLITLVAGFVSDKNIKIFLWDEADLSVKTKNSINTGFVFSFVFPKVYFQFLDNLVPRRDAKSLELFKQVLKTYSDQQVLYSIVKRLRQLLVLKSDEYLDFSEFKGMQSWQLDRLRKQSGLWTEEELTKAFLSYNGLEEKIKTSGLSMDLAQHLDILLMGAL